MKRRSSAAKSRAASVTVSPGCVYEVGLWARGPVPSEGLISKQRETNGGVKG